MGLFLHWSSYVRISFYRFLYYSLLYLHTKKGVNDELIDLDAMEHDYKTITREDHFHPDDKDMVVRASH